jgi:EAL and modified HD-GYP domain-containing signal transduction protein
MSDLLIARQPIFNRNLEVVAYELLYRSVHNIEKAIVIDGDLATTQVIVNTFADIGLDDIVGNKIAFINMTRNFLLGNIPIPFSPNQVILEILENIKVDSQVINSANILHKNGYTFALDDVKTFNQIMPLANLSTIVKIDLMGLGINELTKLIGQFRNSGLKLLAEKVETSAQYDLCHKLGFDLFQGYFLCKPILITGHQLDTSRLVLLRSLAKIQDPEASFESVEEILKTDVNLSYKLFKLVNSAYFFMPTEIKSIRQAIAIIGFEQLKGWMSLLLIMSVKNKPHELTVISLQRARMCEQIAIAANYVDPESYFLAGMLSVLDAIMDIPMFEIVEKIQLSHNIVEGLLYRKGKIGFVLESILLYERGEMGAVFTTGIEPKTMKKIYFDSIKWVTDVLTKLAE